MQILYSEERKKGIASETTKEGQDIWKAQRKRKVTG
jgi:hypothetical protein